MVPTRTPITLWRAAALVVLTSLSAGSSLAQWQWLDRTGSRVFSDTPPPAGTPDKNILKRPGPARAAAAAPTTSPSSTPGGSITSAAAAPLPVGKEGELETRKKRAEEAEQAKRKAEMEKLAKVRAENCEQAKRGKASLDSGMRIATINAKGEREFMDDKARADDRRRLDEVIRSDCGPMPQASAQ